MVTTSRTAAVLLMTAAVLLASCTRSADPQPVAGSEPPAAPEVDASQCEAVDVPLTTIPVHEFEPVMKIPQPPGWERSTKADSELVRFGMANQSLVHNGFAPNVLVGIEYVEDIPDDPAGVFARDRRQVESMFHATDLRATQHTLCGLPAQTVQYRVPARGNVAPLEGRALSVVLKTYFHTYAAMVTVHTANPDNVTYKRDVDAILKGFQFLPLPT
jgi:hypothetical protein